MSVKVRLKMKSCHFICEILPKQDFYLFQFKIAELVSQLPIFKLFSLMHILLQISFPVS